MENSVSIENYEKSPELQTLAPESTGFLRLSEEILVDCPASLGTADTIIRDIRTVRSRIFDFFEPLKTTAHKLHKDICAKEKAVDTPYKEAEGVIRKKMEVYADEQRRIQEVEAIRLRKEQEDAILRMAVDAEKTGDLAVAETLLAIPVAKITTSVPLPDKTSTRQDLVVDVTDIKLLAAEVVAGRIGPGVFTVNESVIKAMVKSHGLEAVNKLGGVTCSYKSTMIFRR